MWGGFDEWRKSTFANLWIIVELLSRGFRLREISEILDATNAYFCRRPVLAFSLLLHVLHL